MNNAQDTDPQHTDLVDRLEAALGPDALDLLRIRADLAPGSDRLVRLLTYTLWLLTEGRKEYPGQAHRREALVAQLSQNDFFQRCAARLAPTQAAALTAAVTPYPLSSLAKLIWLIRDDLQRSFDLMTPAGRESYLNWLLIEGQAQVGYSLQPEDYAALNSPAALEFWLSRTQYPDAIALRTTASPYPLSNWAKVIWLKRDDLRQSFDLTSPSVRQNYLIWLLSEGMMHLGYLPSQSDYDALEPSAALSFWLEKLALPQLQPALGRSHSTAVATSPPDALETDPLRSWLTSQLSQPEFFQHWIRKLAPAMAPMLTAAVAPYPLSNLAKLIWVIREDLQHLFDVVTPAGRENYLSWLLGEGGQRLGYEPQSEDFAALNSPAALEFWLTKTQHPDAIALRSDASPYPLSNWAKIIWLKREDLAQSFDLNYPLERQNYLLWLLGEGKGQTGYIPSQADYDALNSPAALEFWLEQVAFSPAEALRAEQTVAPVSNWAKTVWLKRQDLQRHFDLLQIAGRTAFLAWLADHGLAEERYKAAWQQEPNELAPVAPDPPPAPVEVAIRGFGNKVMGLGEDARTLYAALQSSEIAVAAENLQIPDRSIRVGCEFGRPYRPGSAAKVAIFPLPLWDLTISRLFYGPQLMQGSYNIAFAPWEFGCWPQALNFCSRYVDEVWASTTFLEQAYRQALEVPVYAMPLVVDLPVFKPRSRQFFGLPEDAFIFMYTFDFNSSLVRKNPFDLIKAFQRAFPNVQDLSVALVLKVISLNVKDDLAKQLLATAQRDRRIYLIDTALERADLLALMQSADCYVSLHRSEGFGRTIAEAMLLDKPVITTGYSGNADFCTPETAYIVDYTLRPVAHNEYPHAEDLLWAQPNVETAIEYLRQVIEHPAEARSKTRRAKAFIQQRYSLENVSAVYQQRLSQLL